MIVRQKMGSFRAVETGSPSLHDEIVARRGYCNLSIELKKYWEARHSISN